MDKQEYINSVFGKYNADKDHPDLTEFQKKLLKRLTEASHTVDALVGKLNQLNGEGEQINAELIRHRGMIQGLVDSLWELKDV